MGSCFQKSVYLKKKSHPGKWRHPRRCCFSLQCEAEKGPAGGLGRAFLPPSFLSLTFFKLEKHNLVKANIPQELEFRIFFFFNVYLFVAALGLNLGTRASLKLGLLSSWGSRAQQLQHSMWASQVAVVVKNPLTSAGDVRNAVRKTAWRRAWQPTLVFLPGKSHGQRSLQAMVLAAAKSWTQLSNSTAYPSAK